MEHDLPILTEYEILRLHISMSKLMVVMAVLKTKH